MDNNIVEKENRKLISDKGPKQKRLFTWSDKSIQS